MFTRSFSIYAEQRQSYFPPNEVVGDQPRRRPILIPFAALVFLALAMLVVGVVAVARTETIPRLLDLPESYLPGNTLPRDVSCYKPGDEHTPHWFVPLLGYEVYFDFDAGTRMINRTVIPEQAHTLGQLIASWGIPTGIIRRFEFDTYVCWGSRSAFIWGSSIQPDSRVDFIQYDLEPQQASTWHGFTNRKF